MGLRWLTRFVIICRVLIATTDKCGPMIKQDNQESKSVLKNVDQNYEYNGTCNNGVFHGSGVLKYSDGGIYDGEFRNGRRHGNGTIIYPKSNEKGKLMYTGEWEDDMESGIGKQEYQEVNAYDQISIEGEFKRGLPNGNVTIFMQNGGSYTGEVQDDVLYGYGTFNYSNGDVLSGQFLEGNRTGNGTYFWYEGHSYHGGFKNGFLHGNGTIIWADGDTSHGEYENGEWKNEKTYNKYGKMIYNFKIENGESKVYIFNSFWDVPESKSDNDSICEKMEKTIPDKPPKIPWYIKSNEGRDMQVWKAWELNYTGRGVVVAVVDDGVARCHPDLIKNYDKKASFDFVDMDNDPSPESPLDSHVSNIDKFEKSLNESKMLSFQGTKGAGIIAARRDESMCTIGIAYEARLGSIRRSFSNFSDKQFALSLGFRRDYIDVYNLAWAYDYDDDIGSVFSGPGLLPRQTLKDGITKGRDGAGSVYVKGAGNGGYDDDCNADGFTTSIYTITVSSLNSFNQKNWYSERCSAILATTYSSASNLPGTSIKTTGTPAGCNLFGGTSASTSIASGIIALVLQVGSGINDNHQGSPP